jgi:signal peptidase II
VTAVVAADLFTKRWASRRFADGPVSVIDGVLGFRFTENPGAAFSLLPDAGTFLAIAAVSVSIYLIVLLRRERPWHETVGFSLVIGGALGNLVDRVARGDGFVDGKVIDWIDLGPIPTFNLADASISVALAVIIIGSWREKPRS